MIKVNITIKKCSVCDYEMHPARFMHWPLGDFCPQCLEKKLEELGAVKMEYVSKEVD